MKKVYVLMWKYKSTKVCCNVYDEECFDEALRKYDEIKECKEDILEFSIFVDREILNKEIFN